MVENQGSEIELEVTIMLTDIVGYSRRTSSMTPDKVRDFVIDYHQSLNALINGLLKRLFIFHKAF